MTAAGGTTTLDVRLLGPISAERSGEAIALGGPRQRAVLGRLGVAAGQIVTVDRLIDDVWAGEPPATAVNTLQGYVSLLRRALGDVRHVRREGPGYVLSLSRDELDVTRFEDRCAAGRALLATDPAAALAEFDVALAEWRGPCLADAADEEWARAAATHWEDLRLATVEARFDALLALGRHAEAVGELERAAEEHPLREGLARRLMTAMYRSGRQAEALRVFDRTRERLIEELGLEPTPELVELQTAILQHDASLAGPSAVAAETARAATSMAPVSGSPVAPAPAAPAPAAPSSAVPAPASPVPLPPAVLRTDQGAFVGREPQLAALRRAWEAASSGQRHLVVLGGEAGAGKSRLAAHFATQVHAEGAVVVWGRATPEAIVPFEPMVEAMRTVLRTVSPEARRRVAAERGHLHMLLPELTQIVPEARVDRADPTVERYLLFETVAELLRAESEASPLLFVIDDLQWADAPSLKMIAHVMRHELPSRVMLLGTVRVPGDEPAPELDQLVSMLQREGLVTRVGVDALRPSDVGELLRANGRDDAEALELQAATGGNAFFLTELIRHAGTSSDRPLLADDLPESIRTMVGLRYDRLDPVAQQVLNLTAMAGAAATLPVLAAASGLDVDRLLDAADSAVAVGLLVEDGVGRLDLSHGLIRQAIIGRLSRTRRLDLHRRIADALEHDSEPQSSPATMAHHLIEAGSLADRERRIDAALVAGWNALDIAAIEDAAAWADRAVALLTDQHDPALRVRAELLRSDAARYRGERAVAVDAARKAAQHARSAADPTLMAMAANYWMMALSAVGFDIGVPADADLVDLMETAIAGLPESEVRLRVRMRSMLSSVLVPSDDWERRRSLADEALEIATADGGDEVLASAHLARRLAMWRTELLDERTDEVLLALEHAHRTPNFDLQMTVALFALTDLLEQGRLREHLELLGQFRARAEATHHHVYLVYAKFTEVGHLLGAGRYAEAEALADRTLAEGLSSHGVNARVIHAGIWFRMALDRGRIHTTIAEGERMVAAHPRLRMWQIALVAAYAFSGRPDDARRIFDDIVHPDGVQLRHNQMFLPAACTLAEVAAVLGDAERAAVLHAALEPCAGRLAVSGLAGIAIGPVSRYAGLAAHVSGDEVAAERLLRAGVAQACELGMRPHEARARHDLAAVLDAVGRPAEAADEERRAQEIASEIGLVLP